jgi:hypothetical protein
VTLATESRRRRRAGAVTDRLGVSPGRRTFRVTVTGKLSRRRACSAAAGDVPARGQVSDGHCQAESPSPAYGPAAAASDANLKRCRPRRMLRVATWTRRCRFKFVFRDLVPGPSGY